MDSAIFYFDTLPLHPPPQPLESFTSYLTRLAEANGMRRYSQLNPFFDKNWSTSRFVDYPPHSFGMLPVIASCDESELLRTTFFHVGKKLGRVYDAPGLANFLAGVVASSLRYCPLCLQEALYYSLAWRFLPLKGCPKHACRLLEYCGHCNCPVSIFPSPFRMGTCPTCGGDLRDCISSALTEEELWRVTATSRDIEFLLRPQPWESTEPAFLERLGKEFMLLRYDKQLKRKEVNGETGLSVGILESIELGHNGTTRGTALRWYFQYASYFGVPLSQIFINALERKEEDLRIRTMRGKYFLASEEWVMERVQDAVRQLEMSGQLLTLKAICATTGFSIKGVYKYERVKAFLSRMLYHKKLLSHAPDPLYEEQLLEKAQQALQELAQAGKPITHRSVSSIIGIPSRAIIYYPRLKKLLGHFVDYALQQQKYAEECEQALLEEVRIGVMELKEHQQPITYTAISQIIGVPRDALLHSAQVRAFIAQHLDSRFLRAMKKREQQEVSLLPRVEEALGKLELAREPVSFRRVGKLLGIYPYKLKSYPRVNELIEQRKSPSRLPGRQAGRSEEEVVSEVQRVILVLTERSMSINYKTIAREMGGINAETLATYPKVRRLVDEHLRSYHRYQLQEFALREEQLLRRVEAVIAELEAQGKPFTQDEVCEMVGKSHSTMWQYPRVNAFLKQKITSHHVYQRRRMPPEEEELVQRVKEAINDLSKHGESIRVETVARKVKISKAVLIQYPQVVVLLEQHGYHKRKPRSERVEKLLGLVKDAIHSCRMSGQPITNARVSDMVGVHRATLFGYAEVRALMTQAANEDKQQRQQRRFQTREEELMQQVITALQQFRDTNRRISKKAIAKAVHVARICSYYPKVKALVESAIQAQLTSHDTAVG